jgi:hypothetical protein
MHHWKLCTILTIWMEASSRAFECLCLCMRERGSLVSVREREIYIDVCTRTQHNTPAPFLAPSRTAVQEWILFIMTWRSCFLLHLIGLASNPAYVFSNCNDIYCSRLLFVHEYTHIYTNKSLILLYNMQSGPSEITLFSLSTHLCI